MTTKFVYTFEGNSYTNIDSLYVYIGSSYTYT